MTLADLIDLEAQLARDRDAPVQALEARDRALVASRVAGGPGARAPLLAAWLEALRAKEPGSFFPGRAVERALAAVRTILALLGLVAGFGTSAALVAFTGGHPVDVSSVLLVLVLAQVLLLVALAAAVAFPAATLGAPLVGTFRAIAGALVRSLASRAARARGAGEWRALWHRLRGRRSLYRRVEPWLLLGTTQGFGVAFNVGALAALLRAVVFSDVAFGWGTTLLELSPARFQALAAALAAPWGWLLPDAVPSLALVEATRYSRLEAAYLAAGAGRAADPALVGGWWPFLAAALACYGLLPRAAALAVARIATRRALARLPLADAEVARVARRLAEPHVETRSPGRDTGASPETALVRGAAAPPGGGPPAGVVLWRDVPGGPALAEALRRHLRRELAWIRPAGGRDAGDDAALARAVADGAAGDLRGEGAPEGPVVLVAEGFEAPDRAALRLVRALRAAAGPARELLVLVVDVDVDGGRVRGAGDAAVRVWRDGLARLEDPFLAVEPLAPEGT